jgi:hypothetical protein
MLLGGTVTILILLPNLLVIFFPPVNIPAENGEKSLFLKGIEILERIGQAGCFLTPFFYPLLVRDQQAVAGLAIMAGALAFYYAGWARYMLKGRSFNLLFRPLVGIPLPMAVSPVIYFLAAAAFLQSWVLAAASCVLACGHITVSYFEWRRSEGKAVY